MFAALRFTIVKAVIATLLLTVNFAILYYNMRGRAGSGASLQCALARSVLADESIVSSLIFVFGVIFSLFLGGRFKSWWRGISSIA